MNWLFPALCATLLWGIGQVFIKKGLSDVSPLLSNTFAVIFALLVEIPFALLGGVGWQNFPFILLFGFLASIPNFVFPYVIRNANVSLSGTVLATYPIYTVILSILFLSESLDSAQIVGVLSVITGMILVAKPDKEKFRFAEWVLWAIFGSLAIGFGDFIGKVALTKYNLYSFIMAFTLSGILSLGVTRIFDRTPIKFSFRQKNLVFSIIGNFFMPMGLLALFIAFSKGPASLVSPVASSYPAITAVLAFFYLKEKITKTNLAGIALTTLGVIFMGL